MNDSLNCTASLLYFMKTLTSENEIMVSLCDRSLCFGFIYADQNAIAHVGWIYEANATKCPARASEFSGDLVGHTVSSRREMHFEIRTDGTVGFASSGDPYPYAHAFADRPKPSTGLRLQVCRDQEIEGYEFGYMEFSLKTNKF